jgi:hypothetical protein
MALPAVLVAVLVLSLLGTVLWQVSMSETVQAANEEKRMQAHYIARSGVDAVGEYILRNPNNLESAELGDFIDGLVNAPVSDYVYFGQGKLNVEVKKQGAQILIIGTGYVDHINDTVTLSLLGNSIFDHVIHTNSFTEPLDVTPLANITGPLSANADIIHDPDYPYDINKYANVIYETATAPEWDVWRGSTPHNQNVTVGFDASDTGKNLVYGYDHLQIGSGAVRVLTFETEGHDMIIVANAFTVGSSAKVRINGGGRVLLFVEGNVNIHTGQANFENDPNQLIMFLSENSTASFLSNAGFKGFIYGPDATVHIAQPGTEITGAMIIDTLSTGMSVNSGSIYLESLGFTGFDLIEPYINTSLRKGFYQ